MKKPRETDASYERIALWMKLGPLAVVLGLVGLMMLQTAAITTVERMMAHASPPPGTAEHHPPASRVDIAVERARIAAHVAQR